MTQRPCCHRPAGGGPLTTSGSGVLSGRAPRPGPDRTGPRVIRPREKDHNASAGPGAPVSISCALMRCPQHRSPRWAPPAQRLKAPWQSTTGAGHPGRRWDPGATAWTRSTDPLRRRSVPGAGAGRRETPVGHPRASVSPALSIRHRLFGSAGDLPAVLGARGILCSGRRSDPGPRSIGVSTTPTPVDTGRLTDRGLRLTQ